MICTLSSRYILDRYYLTPVIQVNISTQSTLSLIFRRKEKGGERRVGLTRYWRVTYHIESQMLSHCHTVTRRTLGRSPCVVLCPGCTC